MLRSGRKAASRAMTPFETRASLAPQGEVGGAGERPGVVLEAAMSDSVHKGGCACGRVSVEARGEPYRVGVCHCLTCRKLHGMPFSFYAVFSPDAVTITGKVDVFASSEHGRRYFCPACGSQVWSHYSRPMRSTSIQARSTRPGCGSRPTNCGRSGATRGCRSFRASSAATRKTGRNGAGRSLSDSVRLLCLRSANASCAALTLQAQRRISSRHDLAPRRRRRGCRT